MGKGFGPAEGCGREAKAGGWAKDVLGNFKGKEGRRVRMF